ncbi:MAG: MmgE/PrpD family protein [Myxococcota bacterium]|nr:MmgE/PrpD family protein [Myxococcota bacterium]
MGTHLENMAAWSSAVDAASLPPSVDVRCRMQMLHIVTQIQGSQPIPALRAAGPSRGAARLVDGGSTSVVAAARVHAARAAQADTLDFVIGGATGVGAVTAALACGKGRSLGDLVCAVAAGNEVAGRVGAGMVLGPHHGMGNGWVVSVSAAAAAARMMQLNRTQTAHALALALTAGGPIPRSVLASAGRAAAIGLAVGRGVEAAQLANRGVEGPLDVLEQSGGLMEAGCWVPLSHAFTGLGSAWLTDTVFFPRWPGPVAWHSALDGVDEVLARHVKAADKRLRADQVRSITIRVAAPAVALDQWAVRHGLPDPAGLGHSVRHAIGALVTHHALVVPSSSDDARCGLVAGKVRVVHDISLTMEFIAHALDTVLPLVGGITESELRKLRARVSGPDSLWPRMKWGDIRTFAAQRPDRWLERLRYAPRSLADGQLSAWQWRLGARVEVKTTRGGTWPVTMPIASGGPGTPWEPLQARVLASFGRGDEAVEADGWSVLEMGVESDFEQVVPHLIG